MHVQVLDWLLGEESALFRRQELKALVGIHAETQQDGSGEGQPACAAGLSQGGAHTLQAGQGPGRWHLIWMQRRLSYGAAVQRKLPLVRRSPATALTPAACHPRLHPQWAR